MSTIGALLAGHPGTGDDTASVPTGLADLDEVTGGLRPGQLWVICGPPGAGRTVLVSQWAQQAAADGHAAALVTARETTRHILPLLLASHGGIPRHHMEGSPQLLNPDRYRTAARDLAVLPLSILSAPVGAAFDEMLVGQPPRLLAIDDVDLLALALGRRSLLAELRAVAAGRCTVVLTAADAAVLNGRLPAPEWARVADVVLSIHRPEQHAREDRVGEAELHVLRQRYGPSAVVAVTFEGVYGRFR